MTVPAPSLIPSPYCCISSIDAKSDCQPLELDEPFAPILCKCPFAFCSGACSTRSMTITTAPLLHPNTYHSTYPIKDVPPVCTTSALPKRVPINLAAIQCQIHENMAEMAQLFLPPMPMMTMHLPPQHPEPLLPLSTPTAPTVLPKRETINLKAIQHQIHDNMAEMA